MPFNQWTAMVVSQQHERSQPLFAPMVDMDEKKFSSGNWNFFQVFLNSSRKNNFGN